MNMLTLDEWIDELRKLVANANGAISETSVTVFREEAKKWYDDGFTPYQCFRETYDMENDSK